MEGGGYILAQSDRPDRTALLRNYQMFRNVCIYYIVGAPPRLQRKSIHTWVSRVSAPSHPIHAPSTYTKRLPHCYRRNNPCLRFPTSTDGRRGVSRPTRASTAPNNETNDGVLGGTKAARFTVAPGACKKSDENKIRVASSESAGGHGDRGKTAWMSGWDGMTR